MAHRQNIQQHSATVHHSDHDSKSATYKLKPNSQQQPQNSRFYQQQQQQQQRQLQPIQHYQQYAAQQFQQNRSTQAKSFDDSTLYQSTRDPQNISYAQHHYPQTEPKQHSSSSGHHHHHHQRHRRHSSTSRIKADRGTSSTITGAGVSNVKNSNFITSITNNFMSFGAPFLFDWRLFCERGQPRYVHKHEGDGLRVDECEARFLNKIAQEERASLNAISDEDDQSTSLRHQQRKNKSGSAAANVECLGSVRKSGFLSVKKWLIRKKNSLELARKRGWKGYWVCLKGTTLLFYRCDCDDNKSGGHVIEARPRHLIFVDACLVQAIPEHPKRDFVFCLSTAFGDAYLLDAPCLVERDFWIAAIHCACAAQLARSSGRATVSHVLHKEIKRLEEAIELDTRAKTEAEQIISTALATGSLSANEAKSKQQQLMNQIHNLEEKIEKNRIEIFRFRAYLAAITNEEDPNPKTLLSQTTKRSKIQLNRLGVFSVSSLHAFNCAKNPTIIGNLNRSSSEDNLCAQNSLSTYEHYVQMKSNLSSVHKEVRVTVVVKMLNGELNKFEFNAALSADQVLSKLLPSSIARDYYLRHADDPNIIFKRHETILNHSTITLEIVPKIMFTCEMTRESNDTLFGFSVESELCQDDLRVYVSRVELGSLAAQQSLRRGDEIVVINGAFVQDLDMMYVESILQEELALCLTIRAARDEMTTNSRPSSSQCNFGNTNSWNQNTNVNTAGSFSAVDLTQMPIQQSQQQQQPNTDDLIESLVCPPPPPIDVSQMILSEKQLSKYIVPKVDSYLISPPDNDKLHCHHKKSFIDGHHYHHHHKSTSRSFSSKSAKCSASAKCTVNDQIPIRPHSAAAISYPRSGHHHRHHHHGHHSRSSNAVTNPNLHHHHHHHHHHSSTKHIYHINDPHQANLYGLLEQQLAISGNYDAQQQQPPIVQNQPVDQSTLLTTNPNEQQHVQPTMIPSSSSIGSGIHPEFAQISETELATLNESVISRSDDNNQQQNEKSMDTAKNQMVGLVTTPSMHVEELSSTKNLYGGEITNEKLRKVVHELLDTEITYCQALDQLMTLYLDPLLKSSALKNLDARILIGSIPSVIITQNQFREDLTTIINNDDLNIEGIAKCFLNYSNDFKNYSTFCASHAKAIKLLADEKSILHEWLTKQSKLLKHPNMYSLESYLIRPIQRILKYPLLLSQLKTLCLKDSQPYFKINEALRAIENVAEHINEMQRINEEYGTIFENLLTSTKTGSKKTICPYDLTPTSLLHYGGVEWMNSLEFLGKSFRKSTSSSGGLNLHSMCFVFKQCVVFLCKETVRHGKSKKQSATDMEIIRHQVLIPVSEVQVRACPQTEQELDFKWELIQLKTNAQAKRSEKIFRLANSTNEYRNLFLRTIRQIIREDVRRMNIMGSKQISAKSETSPTTKKNDKKHIVSFASTQNLTRCGYCGEDFTKMFKKVN
ncbi:T-lymphoma invasion and metastasis-inducing protein 1 [Dermatophagoides pteronyssinus]|uniref:T-lymphoma invasion and metastasis-inducing protein 1 n=1 Tax=Dermatophagoides pteronyssinus TaxID=6956 RepID=A0ABQ8IWY0_DERPT|nr:T-lymphoma invasion and metastasis-inducing protein 1 [Dermatophagoides pteronyssinus]